MTFNLQKLRVTDSCFFQTSAKVEPAMGITFNPIIQ